MKELNFENTDGFILDLTTSDTVLVELAHLYKTGKLSLNYYEYLKIEVLANDLCKAQSVICEYYTQNYDYILMTAPNVYFVCEQNIFVGEE